MAAGRRDALIELLFQLLPWSLSWTEMVGPSSAGVAGGLATLASMADFTMALMALGQVAPPLLSCWGRRACP